MAQKKFEDSKTELNFRSPKVPYGSAGDHGGGDESSTVKDDKSVPLGPEWTHKKLGGTLIPFSFGKTDTVAVITETKPVLRRKLRLDPPFTCGLCFGAVLEATVPACGHMFCRRCLDECKKHFNACPMCGGPLGLFVRVYEVDKVMDEYFLHAAPPEETQLFLSTRAERLATAVSNLHRENNTRCGRLRKGWRRLGFRFRSKGFLRASVVTLRSLVPRWGLFRLTKKNAFGVIIMCLIVWLILTQCSCNIDFFKFWWNHLIDGVCQYCECRNRPSAWCESAHRNRVLNEKSEEDQFGFFAWLRRRIFG